MGRSRSVCVSTGDRTASGNLLATCDFNVRPGDSAFQRMPVGPWQAAAQRHPGGNDGPNGAGNEFLLATAAQNLWKLAKVLTLQPVQPA